MSDARQPKHDRDHADDANGGIDDENPEWLAAISQMQHAERLLPDEPMWSVGAAQNLADVLTRLDGLSEEDRGVLIGIGAMLVREGKKEMKAQFQALIALKRIGENRG